MKKVGFIGLGRMGKSMAINMARKGFELAVYDINGRAHAGPSLSLIHVAKRQPPMTRQKKLTSP